MVGVCLFKPPLVLPRDSQLNRLGQEPEAAAQYLNINIADGEDLKRNEFAQIVADNLRRVANLDEAVPFLSKRIVSLSALEMALTCN